MTLSIYEILSKTNTKKTKAEKVRFLRENQSPALRLVLQFALHPNVKVLLPEGPAPFKPAELADENIGKLYSEANRLYLFCEGGNPDLSQNRREALFIQLLESIHPKDAELLITAKDKKLPFKDISRPVITEAFPDIFE